MSDKRNPALIFIFITMLIDVIGFGIIIPVVPKLIAGMIHSNLSDASHYSLLLMFAFASMQFLCSPIIGGLSDHFGRRPVILAALFAFSIDFLLTGFAPTIGWLFVGRLFAGITGASFTSASAYIADISEPEKRTQNFGLIGVAFGVGFIIGPLLGGIIGQYGERLPFFVSAGLAMLNWLYGYFILPESLKPENRRPFDWKRANPLGSLRQLQKYPVILSLVISLIFIYLAGHANQSTWGYYTMEKFHFDEKWVGYSLAFVGLMVAIVQGGLTRVLIPKLGQKRSIFIGLAFYTVGFLLFGMANKGWMMFAFMIPFSLGGLAGPSLQGLISSQVPANEQGELQGALTSLISLTSIIGPVLMLGLFGYFTGKNAPIYLPGAPFYAAALLTLLSLVFVIKPLSKK